MQITLQRGKASDIMVYIVIAAVIALVLPTAHAIWKTYDADMDELGEGKENEE